MENCRKIKIVKIISLLWDILFTIIIIPIIIISIIVIYKTIRYPMQIPDIFGYKPFYDGFFDNDVSKYCATGYHCTGNVETGFYVVKDEP